MDYNPPVPKKSSFFQDLVSTSVVWKLYVAGSVSMLSPSNDRPHDILAASSSTICRLPHEDERVPVTDKHSRWNDHNSAVLASLRSRNGLPAGTQHNFH